MDRADRILLIGAGGHGKVVADLVRSCGYVVAGFVDTDPLKYGRAVEPGGSMVVAAESELLDSLTSGKLPADADRVVSAVGQNVVRLRHTEILGELVAPPLLHPSAVSSPSATLGAGSVVFPLVVINAGAVVGRAVILNSACVVEHDCLIGDGAHISPGAVLAGAVCVGARTWIGAGATVIQGVRIGADVVVGAGAVVLRDVTDGSRVAGVPARQITSRHA